MSSTLEIRCHHCGAGFRLTIRRKRPAMVPCRKCGHEIAVPEESTVRSISHAEIFGTVSSQARSGFDEPEPQDVQTSMEDLAQVEVDPKPVQTHDLVEDFQVPDSQDIEIFDVPELPELAELPDPPQNLEIFEAPSAWAPSFLEAEPDPQDVLELSEDLPAVDVDPTSVRPQEAVEELPVPQDIEIFEGLELPEPPKDVEIFEASEPVSQEPEPPRILESFEDVATEVENPETSRHTQTHQTQRGPAAGLIRLAGVFVILAALATAIWALSREAETRVEYIEPTPDPPEAIRLAVLIEGRAEAISKGIARLRAKSEDELYEEAEAQIRANNFGAAWELIGELLLRSPENVEYQILEIEAKLGIREFHDARILTLRAMSRHEDARLQRFFEESLASDPDLRPGVTNIAELDIDTILPLGGGRSISLKLRKNGENTHVFKPAQKEWGDGWRSEVAAWRFCQIVVCEFLVPHSQAARISRKDFERLYPAQTEHQRNYQARFVDLNWVEQSGPNGTEEWLYGVLKVWVPTIVDFPVEVPELWQPWLSADADPTRLQNSLSEEISPIKHLRNGEVTRAILREHNGAPVSSIARQLSNIFVFDFLTNNWDRWSEREDYYGVNNHFADGRLISLDNGAAFHTLSSSRVDKRFDPVERFSRAMVFSVRRLDPNWVNSILFEDIGLEGTEKERLDVFWIRRNELLERIDTLRSLHGDAKVLYFP